MPSGCGGRGAVRVCKIFEERFGVKGVMVSAVDLLKGIGRLSGMTVCSIPGATGYIDTDYEAKRGRGPAGAAGGPGFGIYPRGGAG